MNGWVVARRARRRLGSRTVLAVRPRPAWLRAPERARRWARNSLCPDPVLDRLDDAFVMVVVLAALAGVAVFAVGGLILLLFAVILGVGGVKAAVSLLSGRLVSRIEADLPLALEEVARSLRSGVSLPLAIAEAAARTPPPLGRELMSVAEGIGTGLTVVAALDRWASRRAVAGVQLAVASLALGAEAGGPQARAVDAVAATLRERLGIRAEVRALASQARLSALLMGVGPVAFCALLVLTDDDAKHFLLQTPAGVACLAVGAGLDAVGAAWMRRLSKVEV